LNHCLEASTIATRLYATTDAARYLGYARQSLDLVERPSARLRFVLLYRHAALVRTHSTREFRPLAEQLLRLAREQHGGVCMARAAWLIDQFPGFPRTPGAHEALLDSLAGLPDNEPSMRAALLARLSTCAPLAYRMADCTAQLERALALASRSPDLSDTMTAHFAELFLYGGPAHRARSNEALRRLQQLSSRDTSLFAMPLVLLDMHRALVALQEGDLATMTHALDRSEARSREFDIELLWHVERFRALARINVEGSHYAGAALLELHQRAEQLQPLGARELCAYDRSVVLADQLGFEGALAHDAGDPPNIWALKVRALAANGTHDEARSALASVSPDALRRLPCDREYLGTLGALARAALLLQEPDYTRVLYELLSPYPEHFAANLSFLCEGSVSQLLGLLARSLGDGKAARQHLRAAVTYSKRAGLGTCAAQAQLELAQC
jgi:hypothetical protein